MSKTINNLNKSLNDIISIGGTNLVTLSHIQHYSGGNITNANSYYTVSETKITANNQPTSSIIPGWKIKTHGKHFQYTVSGFTNLSQVQVYFRCDSNTTTVQSQTSYNIPVTNGYFSFTFDNIPSTTTTINIGIGNATVTSYWVDRLKLEIGNKVTDWSPAPEDEKLFHTHTPAEIGAATSASVGTLSSLQTTNKNNLVAAINELFQSANNGKQLIANAIGEPLSSNDTFSAMSTDINSLLSTFKTNMMNNGVIVESGDKFKQLIDKIKELNEGEGNKGIQFAEGVSDPTTATSTTITVPLNLDFIPTYIFAIIKLTKYGKYSTFNYTNTINGIVSNIKELKSSFSAQNTKGDITISISEFNQESFTINGDYSFTKNTTVNWYAIGIGEEDTTLRDSLASILEDEGVDVTEEDDIASLITKVDEEFTDKETEINSLTNELAGKVTPVGNAVASNVLTGKTFINSTGQTITGTMANNGTKTITPKASAQTLGAGYYDKITINGDADLVAANIVSGKNIFGVTGTAAGSISGSGTPSVSKGFKYERYNDSAGTSTTATATWFYFEFNLNFAPNVIVFEGIINTNRYVTTYIKGLKFLTIQLIGPTGGVINYCVYPDSSVVLGNNKFHIPVFIQQTTYNYYIC